MKQKLFVLMIACCLIGSLAKAQAPNAIPYQGVARNAAGNVLASQPISLRISIHDGSAGGSVVYSETQSATTSTLGLFSVNIGSGTVVTGTMAGVNWGAGSKFLQVEMDATGGSTYTDMGTTQLNSVPYALFSGGSGDWNKSGNDIYTTNTGNVGIGTTTPTSKLDVIGGDANLNGITISRTNGCNSIAIGLGALQSNNSCENVAIGVFAAATVDGVGNTVVGRVALGGNGISTSSSHNSALGLAALGYSSGNNNTGVGSGAGNGINGAGIVTGDNNTFLGSGTYSSIPQITNATAVGANTILSQSNSLILGNNANVGIGTSTPAAKLDVAGTVKIADGSQGTGKILTSDANGLASWQSNTSVHTIGESYGGGTVFYVYDNGQHGLIAATVDVNGGNNIRWYAGTNTNTMAFGDGIGAGASNTAIIVANQGFGDGGTYAARLCQAYSVTSGGVTYGDWYLPSKTELDLLLHQQGIVGNIQSYGYWSSTEGSTTGAWRQDRNNFIQYTTNKTGPTDGSSVRARPIRRF